MTLDPAMVIATAGGAYAQGYRQDGHLQISQEMVNLAKKARGASWAYYPGGLLGPPCRANSELLTHQGRRASRKGLGRGSRPHQSHRLRRPGNTQDRDHPLQVVCQHMQALFERAPLRQCFESSDIDRMIGSTVRVQRPRKAVLNDNTQRHCTTRYAGEHTPRGAMPLRAGQLRR